MSAWQVSENHIRLLVEALYKYEVAPADTTPDALGAMLWRENIRSVNYRYAECGRCPRYTHDSMAMATWEYPRPGSGQIRALGRDTDILYKQVLCYNYQSCEHPGWPTSEAHRLIGRLQAVLNPQGTREMADTAPWGIE